MIRDAPIKFRLLEILEEGGEMWNYEIVPKLMGEYNMKSHHEQQMVNYDLIEMVSAGFLNEGESVIDEEGKFNKGHLLTKYSITPLGIATVDDLKKKVRHYE